MIGDSIKRDIKYANQVGFYTVYKPASFMGKEEPSEFDEQPQSTVTHLGEIKYLMRDLNVISH